MWDVRKANPGNPFSNAPPMWCFSAFAISCPSLGWHLGDCLGSSCSGYGFTTAMGLSASYPWGFSLWRSLLRLCRGVHVFH